MTGYHLAAELHRALEFADSEGGMLKLARSLGVMSRAALDAAGGIGLGRIVVEGRTFRSTDEGEPGIFAHLIAAFDDTGTAVVDLVAWCADNPAKWWTRCDAADVLGMPALLNAACLTHLRDKHRPLLVNTTPLAWLRAAEGICLIHPEVGFGHLYGVPALAFDDPAFGQRIEHLMTRQRFALPQFLVRERHAA